MRRADRLFQIVQFLRTRRITTARWLAEELQVSERTIYRDIQALSLSGVPVEGEAGVGYILRHGLDLPPLMFSQEELDALILGARIVKSWTDPGLAKAADRVLNKVESVFPEQLKQQFDRTCLFSPMMRLPSEVSLNMARVRDAIDNNLKAHFEYTSAAGEDSCRVIWPLGLFFWGSVWTLGAWCELRENFRVFRLDRMRSFTVSKEVYPEKPGRTLNDLIEMQARRC